MPGFLELLKLQNNKLLKLLELKSQEMSMLKAKQIGETKSSTWWSFVYKRIGARFSEQIWGKGGDWRNLREESEKPLKPLGDVGVRCGGSEDGWERKAVQKTSKQQNTVSLFPFWHWLFWRPWAHRICRGSHQNVKIISKPSWDYPNLSRFMNFRLVFYFFVKKRKVNYMEKGNEDCIFTVFMFLLCTIFLLLLLYG